MCYGANLDGNNSVNYRVWAPFVEIMTKYGKKIL